MEFRSPADQSAKATDEIGGQINEIQSATNDAADELSLQATNLRASVDDFLNPARAA